MLSDGRGAGILRTMRGNVRLTRIEIAVIIAVILVILAIAVPGLLSSNRASNEREAVTALKTLAAAEADFRTNDRDKNRVNDFWTADVKGLFTMTPAAELEKGDRPKHLPLELISRSVARDSLSSGHRGKSPDGKRSSPVPIRLRGIPGLLIEREAFVHHQ
jgi:type II secretory pathway pseudopilin PulG